MAEQVEPQQQRERQQHDGTIRVSNNAQPQLFVKLICREFRSGQPTVTLSSLGNAMCVLAESVGLAVNMKVGKIEKIETSQVNVVDDGSFQNTVPKLTVVLSQDENAFMLEGYRLRKVIELFELVAENDIVNVTKLKQLIESDHTMSNDNSNKDEATKYLLTCNPNQLSLNAWKKYFSLLITEKCTNDVFDEIMNNFIGQYKPSDEVVV